MQASCSLQSPLRTGLMRLAPPRGLATHCPVHCRMFVALDTSDMLTGRHPRLPVRRTSDLSRMTLITYGRGCARCPTEGNDSRHELTTAMHQLIHRLIYSFRVDINGSQAQVRFSAPSRIKQHAPLVVRLPVNSFEFQPCGRTPQAAHLTR